MRWGGVRRSTISRSRLVRDRLNKKNFNENIFDALQLLLCCWDDTRLGLAVSTLNDEWNSFNLFFKLRPHLLPILLYKMNDVLNYFNRVLILIFFFVLSQFYFIQSAAEFFFQFFFCEPLEMMELLEKKSYGAIYFTLETNSWKVVVSYKCI